MSYHQLLEITRRSFRTNTAAMNVAGQNVANANTDGYSRQRLTLQADAIGNGGIQTRIPQGSVTGAGVSIQDFARIRDSLLSAAVWEANGYLGSADEEHRITSALEGIFQAGGNGSLTDVLDEFWGAWTDLADNPTDDGVRMAVKSAGETLALTLNRFSSELSSLADQTHEAMILGLQDINKKFDQIAELNTVIENARMQGSPDFASEDKRDQIVKELSQYVPLRVQQEARGGYMVTIGGMAVVQGKESMHIVEDTSAAALTLKFEGTTVTYTPPSDSGGKLAAWYHSLNTTLPGASDQLNEIAYTLVSAVNSLHENPISDDQPPVTLTGSSFFEPLADANGAAAKIQVSATLTTTQIAPFNVTERHFVQDNGTLVNMASAIASLRTGTFTNLDDTSIDSAAINLISGIGAKVHQASTRAVGQSAVVDHLSAMEAGVSAVSIDEEMTNLIKFQQSYSATARVLTTAQEMMDTLLAL